MRKILMASVASAAALVAVGAANAQPLKPVAPGTILVHVNGYLQAGLDTFGSTANVGSGYKLGSVTTNGDARLYFGIDGLTVDDIAYGTQIEVRTTTSNSGQAVGSNSTSSNGGPYLYVKRAYGYVGNKESGYARLGQTDSAFTLLQTGVVEAFGDGAQWTGDGTAKQILPVAPGQFVYADQSALYATSKVVYLTPSYAEPILGGAFSGAVGFEPNSNGVKEGDATLTGTTGAALAATNSAVNAKERQNTFDVAGQYAVKYNGAAIKTSVGFIDGSPIHFDGTNANTTNAASNLDSLQVLEAGAQVTYLGVTLGANVKTGQVEDGYQLKAKGARNALTYIVGGNYVVGPYVIGASFFDGQSAPTAYNLSTVKTTARTISEYGAAVGANYVISKDLSLYTQYLYGHTHQPVSKTVPGNKQGQVLSIGATFKW